MTEPRTLKELDLFRKIDSKEINSIEAYQQLRQEAIKHIKEIKKRKKQKKNQKWKIGYQMQKDWIKMFFNIEEKDLE